jgi:hypothetical protein
MCGHSRAPQFAAREERGAFGIYAGPCVATLVTVGIVGSALTFATFEQRPVSRYRLSDSARIRRFPLPRSVRAQVTSAATFAWTRVTSIATFGASTDHFYRHAWRGLIQPYIMNGCRRI